jgi:hypothetical protein
MNSRGGMTGDSEIEVFMKSGRPKLFADLQPALTNREDQKLARH